MKRRILAVTLAALGLIATGSGSANEFPSKPISLVVVWPAGGAHDVAARLLAEYAGEHLPVTVVVENVTGAAGSNGMRHVERARPDGYTIGLMGMHALVQSFMNPNAPSLDALQPLAFVSSEPGALQIRADAGIDTLDEYIAALREEPGSIIHGNDAMGGNTFVFASRVENFFGIEMTRVPYGGHAPNTAALISGEIQSATLPVPQIAQHHESGAIKVLGVMGEERHFMLPDVPTFKEQGHDLVSGDYYMLFMPKNVPAEVAEKLEAAFLAAMEDERFQQRARQVGLEILPAGMEGASAALDEQVETIYPILLEYGLVHESLKR